MSWNNVKSSVQNSIKQNGSGAITGNLLQGILLTICNEAALGLGPQGKSAYEVWKDEGNVGTVNDFFASLRGKTGDNICLRKTITGIEWKLSSQPDTDYQLLVTIDELKLHFSDLTAADIVALQKPATDAADALTIYVQQKEVVLTQLEQDTESARQNAITATTNADQATTAATSAATAANLATSAAETATTDAIAAAASANQSATEANTAKDSANAAATSANDAADAANQAASDANAATQSTTSAATNAEELNANQSKIVAGEWWAYDLVTHAYVNTGLPARGPGGKGPVVLSNGNYGNWNETTQDYQDTGIVAAATINLEDFPVSFTEAANRENLQTGENVPASFGKIKKWFNDLDALAWKSKVDYNTDIDNLPSIPESQIQSDWEQMDNSKKDFILNKPSIPASTSDLTNDSDFQTSSQTGTQINIHNASGTAHDDIRTAVENRVEKVAGKGLSTEDYTTAEKQKLSGVETSAQKNVQADWSQMNTTADDYIKNKPTIPTPTYGTLTLQAEGINVGSFTSNIDSNINFTGVKNKPRLDDIWWDQTTGVITISFSDAIASTSKIYIHKTDGSNLDGSIGGIGGSGTMTSSGIILTTTSSAGLTFTPLSADDILVEEWILSII